MRRTTLMAMMLAGCQGAPEEGQAPASAPAAEPTARAPSLDPVESEGDAIFAWLDGERYRETWELFPGTSPLHIGAEPHGSLLTTYANPVAMEALERAAPSMPTGAAIVMEDYMADSTLSTMSVMLRVDDPDSGSVEWRFTRFAPTGEIEAGPVDGCRSCHVLEPDLVFGWELGNPLPIDSTGATPSAGGAGR